MQKIKSDENILFNTIYENLVSNDKNTLFYSDGVVQYSWSDAYLYVSFLISQIILPNLGNNNFIYIDTKKGFEIYCAILASFLLRKTYIPIDLNDKSINIEFKTKDLILSLQEHNFDTNNYFLLKENIKFEKKLDLCKFGLHKNIYLSDINPVYIMRSSGSTGRPKLIPISYQNLNNYIKSINSITTFKKGDLFSQIPLIDFDLSVHDMYLTFFHKGTLVPLEPKFASLAARFINSLKINHFLAVPSFVDLLIENPEIKFTEVKNVFLCGESLRTDLAKKIIQAFPNSEYFNLYGPTECTVAVMFYKFDKDKISTNLFPNIPIGNPFQSTKVYLSKEKELLINGSQVFKGYIGKIDEPFLKIKNETYYRSGDICKYENYAYHFLGRMGFQIKYRGYRIELEGVEAFLGNKYLCNFVAIPSNEISLGNFMNITLMHTSKKLNDQQIISSLPKNLKTFSIKYIKKIPINKNGKIDRRKIKELLL